MITEASNRRYELDWLRVIAILVVFLYHSTRFFNLGDWHIKNVNTYVWVEMWNVFISRWMMPLFFRFYPRLSTVFTCQSVCRGIMPFMACTSGTFFSCLSTA